MRTVNIYVSNGDGGDGCQTGGNSAHACDTADDNGNDDCGDRTINGSNDIGDADNDGDGGGDAVMLAMRMMMTMLMQTVMVAANATATVTVTSGMQHMTDDSAALKERLWRCQCR